VDDTKHTADKDRERGPADDSEEAIEDLAVSEDDSEAVKGGASQPAPRLRPGFDTVDL
jgi:hypothetical protein